MKNSSDWREKSSIVLAGGAHNLLTQAHKQDTTGERDLMIGR